MLQKILKYVEKLKKKINNKKILKEKILKKNRLYLKDNKRKTTFKSRRNKFCLFKTKLEFNNSKKDIKNITLYYFLIGFFLIGASLYLFIFSHYFSLKNIEVYRDDDLVNINLVYNSIENFRFKPIAFIDTNDIKQKILENQKSIESIQIKKSLPSSMTISLATHDIIFNIELNDKIYEITSNGVLIPSNNFDPNKKINIYGIDNYGFIDYKQILKKEHLDKIIEIQNNILETNSFLNISSIRYYLKEGEVIIIDDRGAFYIFDLNGIIEEQIDKLNIFYKDFNSEIQRGIIYLDLRIINKIYYCSRDNEFNCRENLKFIYGE